MTTETNNDENNSNDNSGLVAKNKELLGKLKKQQETLDQLQADKEAAESDAAEKAGDWEKLKGQLEAKHKKEIERLTGERDQAIGDLKTIRVDNEIAQTLAKSGVTAAHVPAVEALMHRKVEYADGQATIEGKSITDWATDYFAKDGAIYRPAPDNSGAGASGNDGSVSHAGQFTKENFSSRTGEWMALAKKDPEQAKAIAVSVGRSDLASDL